MHKLAAVTLTVLLFGCAGPVDTLRVESDPVWQGPVAPRAAPSHAARSRAVTPWALWAARPDVHRLRLCESGDRVHAVSPTGKYHGLFQTTASWGRGSRAEQERGAYRLWLRQGWGAWPTCSRKLGLR